MYIGIANSTSREVVAPKGRLTENQLDTSHWHGMGTEEGTRRTCDADVKGKRELLSTGEVSFLLT